MSKSFQNSQQQLPRIQSFVLVFTCYTRKREAEQDAYFWFLRGQRLALQQSLTRIGVSPERQHAAIAQIMAQADQKVSEAVSGAESGS